MNRLYLGDCLDILSAHVPDESVDLIYLDPPFNSKRIYNSFLGGSQWVAFDDTWRWHEAIDDFHAVASDATLGRVMDGLRLILGDGPDLAYLSYMANRLRECHRVLKDTGSIYLHCDPTMNYYLRVVMDALFGKSHFQNEIVWRYGLGAFRARNRFPRKHDTILFYSASRKPQTFNVQRGAPTKQMLRKYCHEDETGRYMLSYGKKYYLKGGKPIDSVWDIPAIAPTSSERMGYPTQKPLALSERIIRSSSNTGDVVMDPFCGCGTTIHAAQNLGRRWIGIDVCANACRVIRNRLDNHFDSVWTEVEFVGIPRTVRDARELASDPFQFEAWAATLVPYMEANSRQRGDHGIDGWGRIPIRKGVFVDMVAQVKAGSANPGHVQAFNGARQQAQADLGVFTCFEDRVTHGMRDAAASAGRFQEWPVLQIYTVEDYFAGRAPDLPLKI